MALAAAGQNPPATSAQTPVFRAGVDLVQLDVSVLDKDRQPVRGLTMADFTVFENGKPQSIAAFAAVDLPDSLTPATPWLRDVAPDVATNVLDNHRVFVLVLDDASAALDPFAGRAVIDSATKIINRLGAGDLATVIFTRDNRHAQDLTSDHAKLLKAVQTFSKSGTVNMDCIYPVYTLSVLERASAYLAAIQQRRKGIVFLSPGILVPPPDKDKCGLNLIFRDIIANAQKANVNFYPIDVCGLGMTKDCPHHPDMLMELADNTGGHATINTNDFEPGIAQMFQENSSYYLLGYRPANQEADGTFRRLDVKVDRPGVEVWTRKNYVAPKPPKPAKPGEAPPPAPSPALLALAEIVPKADLPLRLVAAPFAVPDKQTSTVTLALGLRQPAQTQRMTDDVQVLIKTFTPEGKPLDSADETITVTVPPVRRGSEFTRYELLTHLDMKPGRYEMRISTHSSAFDLRGSVYADVDVPDFAKAPLSISGVILNAVPGLTVAPVQALAAIVPVLPTTAREFARSDRVTAFYRVYQGGTGRPAPVTLATRIVDGQGAVVLEKTETFGGESFGPSRAVDRTLLLPLAQLAPGEYLLSFEATRDKSVVRRDVRFTVR